jgi:hypothetical protein
MTLSYFIIFYHMLSIYRIQNIDMPDTYLQSVQTLSKASSSFRHVPDAPREARVVDPGNIWQQHMF